MSDDFHDIIVILCYQIMGQVCQQKKLEQNQQQFNYQENKLYTNSTHKDLNNQQITSNIINSVPPSSSITQDHNISAINMKLSKLDHLRQSSLGKSVKNKLQQISSFKLNNRERERQGFHKIYLSEIGGAYYGESINNIPNGYGCLQLDNGDYLQGYFTNGFCNGKGRYTKREGSFYEGDIKNNILDGYGRYVDDVSGYRYEGQWKNNLPNGRGQAQYNVQVKYNGQFLNNKKHGRGILMQKGCIFEGNFINDQLHGKALMKLDNGEYFIGLWKNNMKQGEGQYVWPNGNTYRGNYENDKKSGQGIMSYFNGDYYKGQWLYGVKHGIGQYKASKDVIKGRWKEGNLVQKHQRQFQMIIEQ